MNSRRCAMSISPSTCSMVTSKARLERLRASLRRKAVPRTPQLKPSWAGMPKRLLRTTVQLPLSCSKSVPTMENCGSRVRILSRMAR